MNSQKKFFYALMILWLIPLSLFLLANNLRTMQGPYYLGYNADPSYAYLFNALNITQFQPPFHTDHPGTSLQLLGAGVISVKWMFSHLLGNNDSLVGTVLKNPEAYLRAINTFISILIAIATFLVGHKVYRITRSIFPAVILQLSLLMFYQISISLANVSPEPLLVLVALVLIYILVPEIFNEKDYQLSGNKLTRPIFTGMVLGFGVATKVTFLPLTAAVLLLSGFKKKLYAVLSFIIGFVVFTFPIMSSYGRIINWFIGILINQGKYGHGEKGLPSIETFTTNVLTFFGNEPFIFVSLACYLLILVFLLFFKNSQHKKYKLTVQRLLLTACIIIIIQIVITAKHPGIHYLLPAMVITAMVNAALVSLYQRTYNKQMRMKIIGIVGVLVISYGLTNNVVQVINYAKETTSLSNDIEEILAQIKVMNRRDRCVPVSYYRTSYQRFWLYFGNSLAGWNYTNELYKMYPNTLFYNLWTGFFLTFKDPVGKQEIASYLNKGGCVLLFGVPMDSGYSSGEYIEFRYDLILKQILRKEKLALYQLVGFKNQTNILSQ